MTTEYSFNTEGFSQYQKNMVQAVFVELLDLEGITFDYLTLDVERDVFLLENVSGPIEITPQMILDRLAIDDVVRAQNDLIDPE